MEAVNYNIFRPVAESVLFEVITGSRISTNLSMIAASEGCYSGSHISLQDFLKGHNSYACLLWPQPSKRLHQTLNAIRES